MNQSYAIHWALNVQSTILVIVNNSVVNNFFPCTGAFYFVLGNLKPKFRQRLHGIKLLALTKASVIKNHGMNRILSIFVQDIQKLKKLFEIDSNLIHVHVVPFRVLQ